MKNFDETLKFYLAILGIYIYYHFKINMPDECFTTFYQQKAVSELPKCQTELLLTYSKHELHSVPREARARECQK